MDAPLTVMPTKFPLVAPAALALSARLPFTVVRLEPLLSEMFRVVVSEIAPVPLAKRSAFPFAKLIVPTAFVVRFLFAAIVTDWFAVIPAPVVSERLLPRPPHRIAAWR